MREHVLERHAGDEDCPGPVVDAAVGHRRFGRARREGRDPGHRHLSVHGLPAPPWSQLERVVHEERLARCRSPVPVVDLTRVPLPRRDRRRAQLGSGHVLRPRCRRGEGTHDHEHAGNGRGRCLEHEHLACHEVEHRADADSDDVGGDRIDAKRAAEDRHDREVAEQRHRAVQQVKPDEPARDRRSRWAGPIAPGPALMPDEIVQYR